MAHRAKLIVVDADKADTYLQRHYNAKIQLPEVYNSWREMYLDKKRYYIHFYDGWDWPFHCPIHGEPIDECNCGFDCDDFDDFIDTCGKEIYIIG